MNKETYEALKNLIKPIKYSMKTNNFSYFILNPNNVNPDVRHLETWIDEVAKEYQA